MIKRGRLLSGLAAAALLAACQAPVTQSNDEAQAQARAFSSAGYTLAWSDEFSGTSLNSAVWTPELGGGGWGNNELQYYRAENASVGNGLLTITAKRENYGGMSFTSARLKTQDKFTVQYGKLVARIKMPQGYGMWPAFWLLGNNISSVGWPQCGEIDIAEVAGGQGGAVGNQTVYGTLHWYSGGHAMYGKTYNYGQSLAAGFHDYEAEWDAATLVIRIDGLEYYRIDLSPAGLDAFRKPFFFLLNVAVGGNFFAPAISSPSQVTAAFPQTMQVDYVRVYKKGSGTTPGANLITNPGFEASGPTQTPAGWSTWTPAGEVDADFTEAYNGAHAGSYHLTHYRTSPYKIWTYQIKTGLANGLYTFRAWTRSSGGQNQAYLQAKNYGGNALMANVPASSGWTQVTIGNINVTNGQCEVGFYTDAANGNSSVHLDDVEFFKQ